MQDIKQKFGRRCREIRSQKNISQEELAFLASLDRSYIGGVERGQRNISIENIVKIANALEVEIQFLFDFE